MDKKYIDADDIELDFGEGEERKDEKLLELLKKAYTGEIMCYLAVIEASRVVAFTDYKPKPREKFVSYMDDQINQGYYPEIYVYPEGGMFIMSDDYAKYHYYRERGFEYFVCVVLGEPKDEYVLIKGDPFVLPPPKFVLE